MIPVKQTVWALIQTICSTQLIISSLMAYQGYNALWQLDRHLATHNQKVPIVKLFQLIVYYHIYLSVCALWSMLPSCKYSSDVCVWAASYIIIRKLKVSISLSHCTYSPRLELQANNSIYA